MENDEIDRILSHEEEILPSSGFAVSVMDAVKREAAAPRPIPFPWKRALPGVVAGVGALALVLVAVVVGIAQEGRASGVPQFSVSLPSVLAIALQGSLRSAAIWTMLALLTALVSVKLSMRFASGRG